MLQELGYVRDEQVKAVLKKNRTAIRLGSLLVELGYISEKQLDVALSKQRQGETRKRLGEVLVENKYISEYDLTQVLSIHLDFPYIEPAAAMIDQEYRDRKSRQLFRQHTFIPLGRENGHMMAISDPLSQQALEAAQGLLGPDLTPMISMESYILKALDAFEEQDLEDAGEGLGTDQVVDIVNRFIEDAIARGASDIHIEPMSSRIRIRFRKDGSLLHAGDLPISLEGALTNRIKVMAGANITERRRHQDGRILMKLENHGMEIDIRVSFYVTFFGEKVVMRLLTKKTAALRIDDLGLGPKMLDRFREEVLEVPTGVVLITGPTGAGKTTTLYAAVNYCNRVDTNIVTAEDPVEYVIEGVAQCSINPKLGITFEESLRHILRQDPDVIVLGEIRDKLSAESAIQAALTGHKVLTTFHTEDTIGGLLRLMNMDIETFLISSTVVSVLAQRLIKRICPACSETYTPSPRDLRRLKYAAHDLHGHEFKLGSGCEHCDYTGYSGRVGVFELLVLNEYVKDAILSRKTSYEIRRVSLETTGLVTLVEDGLAKAARGITSIQEVMKNLPLLEAPRPLEQIFRLVGDL